MNAYPTALALFGLCVAEGVSLSLADDGLGVELDGDPSEALMTRLAGFLGSHESRERAPSYAALRRLVRASSVAVRELLVLPVRYLGSYPVPYTARGWFRVPPPTQGVVAAVKAAGIACVKPGEFPKPPPGTRCGWDMEWAWTTSRAEFDALVKARVVAFTAKELERAAYAVEHGRAGRQHMARWCGNKLGKDWVLTPELAGADLPHYREGKTFSSLTVGDLLDGLGAELVSVEWKDG